MTKAKEKQLSMRQQLRAQAGSDLGKIKAEALEVLKFICDRDKIDRGELVKAISVGSHKTADHFLVTQLANRYEAELVKLWNDQQKLDLGDDNAKSAN